MNGEDTEKSMDSGGETFRLNIAHYFLFFLLIVVLITCYHIIKPYLHSIILATLLAMIFNPVHKKIEKLVRGRRNLAAFLSCQFLTLVVIIPLTFMIFAVIQQGVNSFDAIYDWVATGEYKKLLESPVIQKALALVESQQPRLQRFFPDLDIHKLELDKILLQASATTGKFLVNQGGSLLGNVTSLIINFLLMLFVFFYIIRDEEKIIATTLHYSPLSASHEQAIMTKVRAVAKSALIGTFITGLAQGAAGGFAFWICGLPGLFWGMVMAFASLVPVVGTALIWVPAAGYLFLSGHWGYGIFMVIWCVVVVGMIDNLVRPLFMTGSAGMSTVLIFFSILGGISYYGLLGVLYGPLVFGLAMVLFYIYQLEFKSYLEAQDNR